MVTEASEQPEEPGRRKVQKGVCNMFGSIQYAKLKITSGPGIPVLGIYIYPTVESRFSNKNLYMNVHSNTMHNSQKLEMIQRCIEMNR